MTTKKTVFEIEVNGHRLKQQCAVETLEEILIWVDIALAHNAKIVIVFFNDTFIEAFIGENN